MPKRTKQGLAAAATLAAAGLGAAAYVQASGGSTERDDANVTGAQADRAKAAALRAANGGTAEGVEREDGRTWEVEVRRTDGTTAEITLDEQLDVVAEESDDEGGRDDDDEREGSDTD